jgi:tetratricopeptide (TPR) repeat protein
VSEGTTQVAELREIAGYTEEGRPSWHPIRAHFGISAFGINSWVATGPGQDLIGEHDELGENAGGHEELYMVTAGHATFTVDGRRIDAPAGTLVYVADPASKRAAISEEEGTTVVVVGAKPGQAFEVSPWEQVAEALRYWTTQEWDKAIAILRAQAERLPDNGGPLYNLACAEARDGRHEDAVEHLTRAVEIEPRFRDLAQADQDLDSIRDDPRFPRTAT